MQDEVKKLTPFEQKFHISLSYILNLVVIAFIILLSLDEPEVYISSMGYIYLISLYLVYSYVAGKFVAGFYKLVTPQEKWITRSKFTHHVNKIVGLLICSFIFAFVSFVITGNVEFFSKL